MRVVILGGGFTGLTAAINLCKAGHEVVVIEKETAAGGLARGFRADGWDWHLERAYHHVFANDSDILTLAQDTGYTGFFFTSPETASLYEVHGMLSVCKLDTPLDLLKLPTLSPVERVRAGIVLAGLKISPFTSFYEQNTAEEFLSKAMGSRAYTVLFGELFRKKFGKYAGNILSSFIWTRINKRTPQLGYPKGGFQKFADHLVEKIRDSGGAVQTGMAVRGITGGSQGYSVLAVKDGVKTSIAADRIISTLPTPALLKLGKDIFPASYLKRLAGIKYLHAACLILESPRKLLEKTYWLNICVPDMPMMVILQHTNMISPDHYGGNEILYIANYVDDGHRLLKTGSDGALSFYAEAIDRIAPQYRESITRRYYFTAPYAQPIFDKDFLARKPEHETPAQGFYVANLDMTYPYDRGTNYAVKLGNDVARLL